MFRKVLYAFCAASAAALLLACGSGQPSPMSPSATAGGGLGAAADGSTLKVTAPTPVAPMNDVQVENRRPSLVAGNSIGRFVSPPDLTYRFQLIGPDGTAFLEPVVAGGDGHTSYDLTDDLDWEAAYTWRVRAEYQGANGPWSTTAGFRTPPPPPPVGGGPYGPIRDISPQEALGILIRVHNELGFNLGSRSTRESRIAWLWTAMAVAHYGHFRFNPGGGDRNWCVKDAGSGRPPSDDVMVRCDSREAWDTVLSAGGDGYRFHLDYLGRLGSDQNVYPPPLSSLPK